MTRLDFADLRAANVERQAKWCPEQVPDLSFRGNELGGEVGEALNVIKKLERERHGWRGSRDTVEHLAEELADVVICADLCAITAGIDLGAAVVRKFDATSEKVGIPVTLGARSKPVEGAELVGQISALLSFCNPLPHIPNTARLLLKRSADTLAALQAEVEELRERAGLFDALRDQSWDLRCFDMPTGGGDADIGWRVIGHWQAEPNERVIAEWYQDDPAAAVMAALGKGGEAIAEAADTDLCPICAKPFKVEDLCATDISEGICHAACIEGSPVVDLETGEGIDGKADTYRYGDDAAAENGG